MSLQSEADKVAACVSGKGTYTMSGKTTIWLLVGIPVLILLVLAVLVPGSIRVYRELSGQTSRLPEIRGCTRIEIEYRPSILHSLFGNPMKRSLLSEEEESYLQSLKSIVLVDSNDIRALTDAVESAQYQGMLRGPTRAAEYVAITGYVGSKRRTSFVIYGSELEIKRGRSLHLFSNPHFSSCLAQLRPQVRPFENRIYCTLTLQTLRTRMRDAMHAESGYPPPAEWCDVIERSMRAMHRPGNKWIFVCPSVRAGRCTYAMNPNCRVDSAPNTVLLFETKAGWNQNGGPELFAFNNHEPRGGLVLLNDGTVKFIRTEEELKQLRWK